MNQSAKATAVGLLAPVLWGMSVGIVRGVSEDFGIAAGFTIMYTISFLLLLMLFGRPKVSVFPWKYRIFGIGSANFCAVCFVFSLAISEGGTQTMQVGMVNYIWPCLTILFAILFNGQRARWWVWAGVLLCMAGVLIVLGGDRGLDPEELRRNLETNPWSYIIAAAGAVSWAAYSSMTRAWSNGGNPVVIIFFNDALIFAVLWLLGFEADMAASGRGWLGVVLGACATGLGYGVWTYGMQRGSMTLLAIGSYFTPVLSCLFASFWIGADLSPTFWQGVMLVVAGSLVCWLSTRGLKAPEAAGEPIAHRKTIRS